jgi:hypothetical protein
MKKALPNIVTLLGILASAVALCLGLLGYIAVAYVSTLLALATQPADGLLADRYGRTQTGELLSSILGLVLGTAVTVTLWRQGIWSGGVCLVLAAMAVILQIIHVGRKLWPTLKWFQNWFHPFFSVCVSLSGAFGFIFLISDNWRARIYLALPLALGGVIAAVLRFGTMESWFSWGLQEETALPPKKK